MDTMMILLILTVILLITILVLLIFRASPNYANDFSSILIGLKNEGNEIKTNTEAKSNYLENKILQEFSNNRKEVVLSAQRNQSALGDQLTLFGELQSSSLNQVQNLMNSFMESNNVGFVELKDSMTKSMADIRHEVYNRLDSIQKDNSLQLEKMRKTVDEKLQETLETRLGQSFEIVSKRLEEVQKGLGEMQTLAAGVGDLKKVLSNVKTRGVMGELQLANILEEVLTTDQYAVNVATIPNSRNHVEFALKLPGKSEQQKQVWLPIDSKFPLDKYEQLLDAYDAGEKDQINIAKKELMRTVRTMAKDIKDKYIAPPHTTDFAILFLPVEGLYAEVMRDPGILHTLQSQYKIVVAGPNNLAAFLNSIQMGFRSLAIEKRSSEVWDVLGAVKLEFGKFGGVLDKVQKQLNTASKSIEQVGVRTRAIERNLQKVEEMPANEEPHPLADGLDVEDLLEE